MFQKWKGLHPPPSPPVDDYTDTYYKKNALKQ